MRPEDKVVCSAATRVLVFPCLRVGSCFFLRKREKNFFLSNGRTVHSRLSEWYWMHNSQIFVRFSTSKSPVTPWEEQIWREQATNTGLDTRKSKEERELRKEDASVPFSRVATPSLRRYAFHGDLVRGLSPRIER